MHSKRFFLAIFLAITLVSAIVILVDRSPRPVQTIKFTPR